MLNDYQVTGKLILKVSAIDEAGDIEDKLCQAFKKAFYWQRYRSMIISYGSLFFNHEEAVHALQSIADCVESGDVYVYSQKERPVHRKYTFSDGQLFYEEGKVVWEDQTEKIRPSGQFTNARYIRLNEDGFWVIKAEKDGGDTVVAYVDDDNGKAVYVDPDARKSMHVRDAIGKGPGKEKKCTK